MAENTTTRTSTARKSTARKSTATRAAGRSTAAKSPTTATARRSRTIAANETREAAEANVRAAKTTAEQGRNVAERAALVYVGATLAARDRAIALVSDLRDVTTTRKGAEKRISKLERRGNTARNQLERDVRKAPRPPHARAGRARGERGRARRRPPAQRRRRPGRARRDGGAGRRRRGRARRGHRAGARHLARVSDRTYPCTPDGSGGQGEVRRPHIPPADAVPLLPQPPPCLRARRRCLT